MSRVDVLIITALAEEYDAVLEAGLRGYADNPGVADWEDIDADAPPRFVQGRYVLVGGSHLSVAVARATRMGGTATSPVASSLTERLKPTRVAKLGVLESWRVRLICHAANHVDGLHACCSGWVGRHFLARWQALRE